MSHRANKKPITKIRPLTALRRLTRDSGMAKLTMLVVLLVWCIALGTAAANRQNIYDWWQLRSYQVPSEVAKLATQDAMTAYARKIYYVNHAAVEDKATFRLQGSMAGRRRAGDRKCVIGPIAQRAALRCLSG